MMRTFARVLPVVLTVTAGLVLPQGAGATTLASWSGDRGGPVLQGLRDQSIAPRRAVAHTAVGPDDSPHTWYVVAPTITTTKGTGTAPDADAKSLATAVANYWKVQANGKIGTVTIVPTVAHFTRTATDVSCGLLNNNEYLQMRAAAIDATHADLAAGDQILLMLPKAQCVGSGVVGRGDVGSSFASGGFTMVSDDPATDVASAAHEVGHNYGFLHAGINTTCAGNLSNCVDEYGGVYDVMGYAVPGSYATDATRGLPALNTIFRVEAGITDPGEVDDADATSKAEQTWTIDPRSDSAGLRSIHLVDPATGNDMWLDYRSGTGQDASAAYATAGARLFIEGGDAHSPQVLMDYSPGIVMEEKVSGSDRTLVVPARLATTKVDGQAALVDGASWTNSDGSLTITVGAVTPTGAQVTVQYGDPVPVPGTPSISGTAKVGVKLTGVDGTWKHFTTMTRQWLVAGTPVSGATGNTFTPRPADLGKVVTFRVTGTAGGTPTTRSAVTKPVVAGTLSSVVPKLTGTARVGRTLKATPGAWTGGTTLSYAWFVNGKAVKHATKTTLKLTKAMAGKRIVVKVTGRKAGYATVVRASKASAKVAR